MGSASTTKAERRNLRQTLGDTAAEAIEQSRSIASTLQLQHVALARELQETQRQFDVVRASRTADQVAAAERLESLDHRTEALRTDITALVDLEGYNRRELRRVRNEVIDHNVESIVWGSLGLFGRLRWLATGYLPPMPRLAVTAVTEGEP